MEDFNYTPEHIYHNGVNSVVTSKQIKDAIELKDLEKLYDLYNGTDRHYHNWNHVISMMDYLEEYVVENSTVPIFTNGVIRTILFHDAIYEINTPHGSNEQLSGDMAFDSHWPLYSGRIDAGIFSRAICREEILLSAMHAIDVTKKGSIASEISITNAHESLLFLDIDLRSLALPEKEFHEMSDNIMKEYAIVYSEKEILQGRIEFFKKMLGKERIYYTDYFYDRFNSTAVRNMKSGIEKALLRLNEIS